MYVYTQNYVYEFIIIFKNIKNNNIVIFGKILHD